MDEDLSAPPYAKHRVVGLVGFKGSGKDTAAAGLIKHSSHFKRFTFAEPIKAACASVFGWDRAALEGDTPNSRAWREKVDPFWSKKLGDPEFTPRKALQRFGTEAMRDVFSPDIWVAALENAAASHLCTHERNAIVIPDTRFPNEIAKIREMGGVVIRIKRGDEPKWFEELVAGKDPATIEGIPHVSEWAWYRCELDSVVENDGTIQDLHDVMEGVYEKLFREASVGGCDGARN